MATPDGRHLVLAFDTAQPHCAAALGRFPQVPDLAARGMVATRVEPMTTGHAERLLPMLEEVLAAEGLTWGDLDAIGVGTGPGNFTGIRIAVAAARGLALGLDIPAVGVSYFEAVAPSRPRPFWALVPGSLGQTYARRMAVPPEEPLALDRAAVDRLDGDRVWLADVPAEAVVANMAGIAAARRTLPGLSRPAPLYLRPPDAAPPRDPAPTILPG